jgi:hypothetical protein
MNNDLDSSQPTLPSQPTNKRKNPPTKNSNKNKIVKNSSNNLTTSTINFDDETDDNNEQNVEKSIESSLVWKFAKRNDDKKSATCLLCGKRLSTSNWSTTSIRRHLIQAHNKTQVILRSEKTEKASTIAATLKKKLHQLSVEAVIKDNLPFNAFMKSGLSKLIKEAVPGNITLSLI